MFKVREDYSKVKKGDVFGKLTVIGIPFVMRVPHKGCPIGKRVIHCVAECQCGLTVIVETGRLGRYVRQGCINCSRRTHGLGDTSLYQSWAGMKTRCSNPNQRSFKRYGERQILVCDEWTEFEGFAEWANRSGYEPGLQIDRIDNDRGYEPDNCRWVTPSQNCRNKSNNRMIDAFGETKCCREWIEDDRCIVMENTFRTRLERGWSPEAAMTAPAGHIKPWDWNRMSEIEKQAIKQGKPLGTPV